jgi:hypothetical protein
VTGCLLQVEVSEIVVADKARLLRVADAWIDPDAARVALAKIIIELAKQGERDCGRLVNDALMHLRA